MSADAVVAESLTALKRGRVVCVPGFTNRLLVVLGRLGLTPLLVHSMVRRFPNAAAYMPGRRS